MRESAHMISRELVVALKALGFKPYRARATTWKTVMVLTNSSDQTLFLMFSHVGVDLKLYDDAVSLEFDEQGRLYTRGGDMHRFRHDSMADGVDLNQFIIKIAEKFAAADQGMAGELRLDGIVNKRESWCKLCLFDLDNTLLRTDDLERFRGTAFAAPVGGSTRHRGADSEYVLALADAIRARADRHIYSANSLATLRHLHPNLMIGVSTNSPREYARTLLESAYPNFSWDVLTTFDDINQNKRSGKGVVLAMESLKIADPTSVVLVGDGEADIEAAYNAGCRVALEKSTFPIAWTNSEYRLLDRVPDAILGGADDLYKLLNEPDGYFPTLEVVAANGKEAFVPRWSKANFQCEFPEGVSARVPISFLGRYFTSAFHKRAALHQLSRQLLAFKDSADFPQTWLISIARIVTMWRRANQGAVLVVTVMPRKPGRPNRMEKLLECIKERLNEPRIIYSDQILGFAKAASSMHEKRLSRGERIRNVQATMELREPAVVSGSSVLVLDDIVTTGASLIWAKALLESAGATKVTCLALARAISPNVGRD